MGKYDTANTLAILAAGRKPQWEEQTAFTGAPDSASDGVHLEQAIVAVVKIHMREDVHRRTARVTVSTLDLAANYTITINGTACTAIGPFVSRAALIAALVIAVNTGVGATVTATAEDEDDVIAGVDTVLIVGDVEVDYTIAVSATGTGVLACVADPTTAGLRLFVTGVDPSPPEGWSKPLNADYTLNYRGFAERFEIAGFDRAYIELYDVDGTGDGASVTYNPRAWIGPCVIE